MLRKIFPSLKDQNILQIIITELSLFLQCQASLDFDTLPEATPCGYASNVNLISLTKMKSKSSHLRIDCYTRNFSGVSGCFLQSAA